MCRDASIHLTIRTVPYTTTTCTAASFGAILRTKTPVTPAPVRLIPQILKYYLTITFKPNYYIGITRRIHTIRIIVPKPTEAHIPRSPVLGVLRVVTVPLGAASLDPEDSYNQHDWYIRHERTSQYDRHPRCRETQIRIIGTIG